MEESTTVKLQITDDYFLYIVSLGYYYGDKNTHALHHPELRLAMKEAKNKGLVTFKDKNNKPLGELTNLTKAWINLTQ